jgi:hypothetical protein
MSPILTVKLVLAWPDILGIMGFIVRNNAILPNLRHNARELKDPVNYYRHKRRNDNLEDIALPA